MRIRHLITVITHECQEGSISFNKQYGCLISLFNHSSGFWQRWRADARLSSEGESEMENEELEMFEFTEVLQLLGSGGFKRLSGFVTSSIYCSRTNKRHVKDS